MRDGEAGVMGERVAAVEEAGMRRRGGGDRMEAGLLGPGGR